MTSRPAFSIEGNCLPLTRSTTTPETRDPSSPSLQSGGIAYEQKYLLTPEQARDLAEWARQHLQPDPHGDEAGKYAIQTLYLDTPDLEIFRCRGWYATRKFRIRRYGNEQRVWLEVKRKRGDRVHKTRESTELLSLPVLGEVPPEPGGWFHQACLTRQLRPVCTVHYQRQAWMNADGTSARLTIDGEIQAQLALGWNIPDPSHGAVAFSRSLRILELKFRDVMPTIFRVLLQEFPLRPATYSKYRNAVESVVPISLLGRTIPVDAGRDGGIDLEPSSGH